MEKNILYILFLCCTLYFTVFVFHNIFFIKSNDLSFYQGLQRNNYFFIEHFDHQMLIHHNTVIWFNNIYFHSYLQSQWFYLCLFAVNLLSSSIFIVYFVIFTESHDNYHYYRCNKMKKQMTEIWDARLEFPFILFRINYNDNYKKKIFSKFNWMFCSPFYFAI